MTDTASPTDSATTDTAAGWPTEETDEQFAAKQDAAESPFAGAEVDENGVATPAAGYEAMKAVIDPEIGINVVDLGLVYDITINEGTAYMRMTLTSMGCPLTELIHQQATLVLTRLPGIDDAEVEFVFSPPWTTDMISPEAREELRAMGFNV
ncbi:metal-sulfur cluster assembly factor [Euzebya tangerina]|uniref:metal-sulfur cluster assembly factor n=1 Tax=Euzebya tangerina TaxID=591198 RepID=UPI000E3161A3|nr:metal-sulfur cluster assembly factor [Euzebya tangerina]